MLDISSQRQETAVQVVRLAKVLQEVQSSRSHMVRVQQAASALCVKMEGMYVCMRARWTGTGTRMGRPEWELLASSRHV